VAICGGLSKSDFFIQTISDVLNLKVVKPLEPESVLLGSAILAACAAADSAKSLQDSVQAMQGPAKMYHPSPLDSGFHRKKYQVFKAMIEDQIKYRDIMKS